MNFKALHRRLGIPEDYGRQPHIPRQREPARLVAVGEDIYGRVQRLTPAAAQAWLALRESAAGDGVDIQLVSGFRSVEYQARLFERKLQAGERIQDILKVNAPPGYSQHHSGNAVDVATPGCPPLVEAFDETPAFGWLSENAGRCLFSMPYPRRNRYGFAYEPWHWYFDPGQKDSTG